MTHATADVNLFLIVLGGRPPGRNIEQHDIVFAVGATVKDTTRAIRKSWDISVHIDAYIAIEQVDSYDVTIAAEPGPATDIRLYFVNLGGYRENDLEEYHKKLVLPAHSIEEAKQLAKQDSWFKEGLQEPSARSHVDDKIGLFGFNVDDTMVVNDAIRPEHFIILRENPSARFANNKIVPGYTRLER